MTVGDLARDAASVGEDERRLRDIAAEPRRWRVRQPHLGQPVSMLEVDTEPLTCASAEASGLPARVSITVERVGGPQPGLGDEREAVSRRGDRGGVVIDGDG